MLSHREDRDSLHKNAVSRSSHRPRISFPLWLIGRIDRSLSHKWLCVSESCHSVSFCFHTPTEPHPITHTSCTAIIILVSVGRLATPFHFITFIKYFTGDSRVCHSSEALVKIWQDINTVTGAFTGWCFLLGYRGVRHLSSEWEQAAATHSLCLWLQFLRLSTHSYNLISS